MIHLITVYPPEDLFLEDVLKQAGISVIKIREAIGTVHGISIGPLAEIKLYVPKAQEQAANEIIRDIEKFSICNNNESD
ncbi:MAG: hypothetical protein ACOX5W_01125 [Bacillota bacterium]|jgi:hypothetical protein